MMNNSLVRSLSMDSLGPCSLSFGDDDASWQSKSSADAFLDLINDGEDDVTPLVTNMVIDITGDDDDDYSIDLLEEPLVEAVGVHHEHSMQAMFFDEEEAHRIQAFSQQPQNDNHGGVSSPFGGFTDEISSLLTGDLIELDEPVLVNAEAAGASIRRDDDVVAKQQQYEQQQQQQQQQQQRAQLESVARIMGYIHHTEQDRELVRQAEEIVRECQWRHQRNKEHKYRNLSGAIFERLVQLFGGPRFQEIYKNSLQFDIAAASASYHHQHHQRAATMMTAPPAAAVGPKTLEVAIAYGMHMARLHGADGGDPSKSQLEVVQNGVAQFNSMSEHERQMFWEYATRQQS